MQEENLESIDTIPLVDKTCTNYLSDQKTPYRFVISRNKLQKQICFQYNQKRSYQGSQSPRFDKNLNQSIRFPSLSNKTPDEGKIAKDRVQRINQSYNQNPQEERVYKNRKQIKVSYPNLRELQNFIMDSKQKTSLQHILTKNPQLATSLELYIGGHYKKENKYQIKPANVQYYLNNFFLKLSPYRIESINESTQTIQEQVKQAASKKNHSRLLQSRDIQLFNAYMPQRQKHNKESKLHYYIGPGNNSELIRRVMQTRSNWSEASQQQYVINFRWQMTQYGIKYERMMPEQTIIKESCNHFEFHKELTTKTGLIQNLSKYCNINLLNPFTITPWSFQINLDGNNWEQEAQCFINFYNFNMPSKLKETINFRSHLELKFKKTFLSSQYRFSDKEVFQIAEKERLSKLGKLQNVFIQENSYLWLLKPADMNRGNGVHVFTTIDELQVLLNKYYIGTYLEEYQSTANKVLYQQPIINQTIDQSPSIQVSQSAQEVGQNKGQFLKCKKFIIQKYLEQPLLIKGRKFDIRVWVILTHKMQFYLFKEGYIRTSSQSFSLNDQNPFVHLTNNAVQKFSKEYGTFEDGNQLSYQTFEQQIKQSNKYLFKRLNSPEFSLQAKIIPSIKQQIIATFQSVRHKINKNQRQHCFEIFGYDFMVDKSFKVWLIEVNTNPCIEESSQLLGQLIPRMIDDGFKLTLDEIFTRPRNCTQSNFPIPNYSNEENLWELIGSY